MGVIGVDIGTEVRLIKEKIEGIIDPAQRLGALAQVQNEINELTKWLGPYGERGKAAREAMQVHAQKRGERPNTVTVISRISGLSPATIRHLAAIATEGDE